MKAKIDRIDNFYSNIIDQKDKTIKEWVTISDESGESIDTKFRRLLINYKSVKELESVRELKESLKKQVILVESATQTESMEQVPTNDKRLKQSRNETHSNTKPKSHMTRDDKQSGSSVSNGISNVHIKNAASSRSNDKQNLSIKEASNRSGVTPKVPTKDALKSKGCWFGKNCFREECKFDHNIEALPPRCRLDIRCKRDDCLYVHSNNCLNGEKCVISSCNKRHIRRNVNNKQAKQNNCWYNVECSRKNCIFQHSDDCISKNNCTKNDCKKRHNVNDKSDKSSIDERDSSQNKNRHSNGYTKDNNNGLTYNHDNGRQGTQATSYQNDIGISSKGNHEQMNYDQSMEIYPTPYKKDHVHDHSVMCGYPKEQVPYMIANRELNQHNETVPTTSTNMNSASKNPFEQVPYMIANRECNQYNEAVPTTSRVNYDPTWIRYYQPVANQFVQQDSFLGPKNLMSRH